MPGRDRKDRASKRILLSEAGGLGEKEDASEGRARLISAREALLDLEAIYDGNFVPNFLRLRCSLPALRSGPLLVG